MAVTTMENSEVYLDDTKVLLSTSEAIPDSDWIYDPTNPMNDRQMIHLGDLDVVLEEFYPTTDPEVVSNEIDLHADGGEEPMDISDVEDNDLNNNASSSNPEIVIRDAASKENTTETLYNELELPSKRPRLSHIIAVDDTITSVPTSNTPAAGLFSPASAQPGEQPRQMTVPRFTCSTLPDPFISPSSLNSAYPAVLSRPELGRNPTLATVLDRSIVNLPKRPNVIIPGTKIVELTQRYRGQGSARGHDQLPQNVPRNLNDPREQVSADLFSGDQHVNNGSPWLDGFGTPLPGPSTPYAIDVSSYNVLPSIKGVRTPSPHRMKTFETGANTDNGAFPTNSFHTSSPDLYIPFGSSVNLNNGQSPINSLRTPSLAHHGLLGASANFGHGIAPINDLHSLHNLPNGPFGTGASARNGLSINTFQTPSPVKSTTVKKQTRDVFTAVQNRRNRRNQATTKGASMAVPAGSMWSFGNADYRPPTRGKNKDDAKDRMSTEEFATIMNQKVEKWNRRNNSPWKNASNWNSNPN